MCPWTEEYYPLRYATDGTILDNLRFALRYEPADLGILHSVLVALGGDALAAWVRAEPTGSHSRRAWFFYETLTGDALDLPNAQSGNYIDALNSAFHFVAAPINAPRYRVRNNLLGGADLCPRPSDVPVLMHGWMALTERMLQAPLDPVIAAAVSAFAFVFIHPFEDGNGRMHRFLIHYALQQRNFTPPGVIFPVSAAILRRRHLYDAVLEAFSKPALAAIDWEFTDDHRAVVNNDTCNLYRFFDATPQAEYLYDRIAETIREDFKEELDFVTLFDAAFTAVRTVVEMPDRRAALLVRVCLQNGCKLSQNKRRQFPELTDAEIAAMEEALSRLLLSVRDQG